MELYKDRRHHRDDCSARGFCPTKYLIIYFEVMLYDLAILYMVHGWRRGGADSL